MVGALAPLLAVAALATAIPGTAAAAGASTVNGTVTVPAGVDATHVHALLLDSSGSEAAESPVTDSTGSTTTGTYTFADVANGTYEVYFIDSHGTDDLVPTYYGGATTFASATGVLITGDDTLTASTLASGGAISGTVTDPNSGDAGTSIEACLIGTPDPGQAAYGGTTVDGRLCSAGTVSAGTYSVGGLVPGDAYVLRYRFDNTTAGFTDDLYVDGSSLTADLGSATDFTPQSGSEVTAPIAVPALGSITGTATTPAGVPDTAFTVEATDGAGTALDPAVTFSSGAYTIAGLLPGSYRLDFLPDSSLIAQQYYSAAVTLATATPVAVTGGAATPNIDVTLTAAATISGTVAAAQGGADLGGLEVDVLDANGDVIASTFTNANGTYSIGGLPAGTWYLRFDGGSAFGGTDYAQEFYGGSSTLAGSASVVLTAGESLVGVNQALMVQSTIVPGPPTLTNGAFSGLYDNRVALRFKLTFGTGTAGYLASFRIKLPKNISWNKSKIGTDLVLAHDTFTHVIKSGQLVITFPTGKKTVSFELKAGGITVTKAIEAKAAAHAIASEEIAVAAISTTGLTTSLSFTVNQPH